MGGGDIDFRHAAQVHKVTVGRQPYLHWVPKLQCNTMHTLTVRLCAFVYFIAFLGNVLDGPVMWLLLPPSGASTAQNLLRKNQLGCLASFLTCLRPRWWGALLVCWPLWYESAEHGRRWFNFGWDQMINEVGFLCILLSVTLNLYDDVVTRVDQREQEDCVPPEPSCDDETLLSQSSADLLPSDTLHARKGTAAAANTSSSSSSSDSHDGGKATGGSRVRSTADWLKLIWGVEEPVLAPDQLQPCGPLVTWAREAVEISLTLVAFRLFLAAGMLKMRRGSDCWRDHTCLYDHFETQPMPNAVAWYVNALAPHSALRLMQWFSIDVAEVLVPYLFLGCLLSMGPVGLVHKHLLASARNPVSVCILQFPARFVASSLTMVFLCGMCISGNYAFLHVLSLVPLVGCMSTARGEPMIGTVQKDPTVCRAFRCLAPFVVIFLSIFAFLPSLQAYAWLCTGSEYGWPMIGPLMQTSVVQQANGFYLGIPYNRHAYFAGAVHSRNEVVLYGDFGAGWIELDIPCKVGRENRRPCQTAPLHRRFAWEWWFLELGEEPDWLFDFMKHLCAGHPIVWSALEVPWPEGVDPAKMRRVGVRSYNYHFTTIGGNGTWWPEAWWTRQDMDGLTPPFDMPCK
mmetsp:Transcript_1438/g.3928  ORF Transcript_1438/g.3928 Transcript_1438/m.3928 type:complete len:627 (+) Transcript_1438:32-1912(+)